MVPITLWYTVYMLCCAQAVWVDALEVRNLW